MSDEQQIKEDLAGMVGTVLAGTYRLDALIGEGGMGAVYRGRHVLLRRDVAIKVLHPDFSRDPELVKRFDREAQSAARLNHPNCIQVTEFGSTDEGMKYLVMQLLEGKELAEYLFEVGKMPAGPAVSGTFAISEPAMAVATSTAATMAAVSTNCTPRSEPRPRNATHSRGVSVVASVSRGFIATA